MPALYYQSALTLCREIRDRKITSRELLEVFLERLSRIDAKLNAVVVTDVEGARRRADEADQALRNGEIWGPIHGLPVTIKESFALTGLPTTWGDPKYKSNIARSDASAVRLLRDAGAVIFGKTNVPLMLADWQTFNEIYGTTNNPWDLERTPGGSSGGSAAALAAGLTALEVGTDIGASLRNPAHYCGLFAHKPTYGIVSLEGHSVSNRISGADISVVGPMARSASDLSTALNILVGTNDVDSRGWRVELPAPSLKSLRGLRVGLARSCGEAEVDASVGDRIQDLADFLDSQGVTVDETAAPDISAHEVHELYIKLLRAATSVRISDEQFHADLLSSKGISRKDASYPSRVSLGHTIYHREWLQLNERRHELRLKWERFFDDFDFFICPIAATTAPLHDQKGERWQRKIDVNGRAVPTTDQLFWAGYTGAFYLPATAIPIGQTNGLPVGVQICGRQYSDLNCIAMAELLEREFYSFAPPPLWP